MESSSTSISFSLLSKLQSPNHQTWCYRQLQHRVLTQRRAHSTAFLVWWTLLPSSQFTSRIIKVQILTYLKKISTSSTSSSNLNLDTNSKCFHSRHSIRRIEMELIPHTILSMNTSIHLSWLLNSNNSSTCSENQANYPKGTFDAFWAWNDVI